MVQVHVLVLKVSYMSIFHSNWIGYIQGMHADINIKETQKILYKSSKYGNITNGNNYYSHAVPSESESELSKSEIKTSASASRPTEQQATKQNMKQNETKHKHNEVYMYMQVQDNLIITLSLGSIETDRVVSEPCYNEVTFYRHVAKLSIWKP